ncbi:MAG: flavodoxin family protein [Dehalococcoidia bacterium]
MKIVGIAGSPRRGGNTDILLERSLEGAKSAGAHVEKIVLCEMHIEPCRHCDGCLKEGKCVIDDDMQSIYPRLREADVIVIASPMFFMGLTAQTKAMIDRCQALWALKYVLKQPVALNAGGSRKGFFISVGGTKFKNLFDGARTTIKSWFIVIDAKLVDEATYSQIDAKGAIKEHPTALEDAFEAGKRFAVES